MTIQADSTADGVKISVEGRFDFSAHKEFRQAYESGTETDSYTLDMKDATYLDSSALGMLLLLRDHAGGDDSTVEIINCNTEVKKILSISNFEQLFTIH